MPGTYTANVTATPTNGAEPPVVTVVTLIVAAPPSLTVGGVTATPGTPGVAVPNTPAAVNYTYGAAAPAAITIPVSLSATTETLTEPLTCSPITYGSGASGWATLTTCPASVTNNGAGTNIVLTLNPLTPVLAPGTYTATFTVTASDGNVPATYTSAVTYTVTLNVTGSLTATAANSLFTYVIGTASNDLPLVITSQPAGVTFNISTSANLAASIMTGNTPNTPLISVNGTTLLTASATPGLFNAALGVLSGSITVAVPNSSLNCPAAQVSVVGGVSVCTVTVPFTLDVHDSFFQGETPLNNGSGFYNLPFFGTYAYFPSQLAIYHTTLGEELLFSLTDANRGIYMYDVPSGNIWYTSPSLYPFFYDFTTSQWLEYIVGTGNGTAGSRQFYSWTASTTTPVTYTYTGQISK